ncbi:hypothetical protein DSM112329_01438 [Paraconexibacter sp. AEG42_29]|uniref:HTH merR-type domain-containing protein n=1 Tax=Paraconexibacter sp. AEG42_29 TaxID=2997339 RepID=A0AAU7ASI3_9ACTN
MNVDGLLKMSELAEASGVSAGTIKHYLREGLLGDDADVVRTSRNMAYYPPSYVERVRLIKRLQEDRYMPLRVIKDLLAGGPSRARDLLELEDRILERAAAVDDAQGRVAVDEAASRHDLPARMLERLAELGVLTPDDRGYGPDDIAIIEAMEDFRAGGYDEVLGFTVYETLRYKEALEPLVREEVRVILDRFAGEVDPDRAAEIVAAGAQPLRALIGAMHSKLLLAELRRARS